VACNSKVVTLYIEIDQIVALDDIILLGSNQLGMESFPKLQVLRLSDCFPEVLVAFVEIEGLNGVKCKRIDVVDERRKPIYAGLLMARIKCSQFEHSAGMYSPHSVEHSAPSLRTIHNSDMNFFPSPKDGPAFTVLPGTLDTAHCAVSKPVSPFKLATI